MPLPLLPTLVEVRNAVAVRARLARNGQLLTAQIPVIDETIRKAQRHIYTSFPWAVNSIRRSTTLTANQSSYDLPADIYPGQIHYLAVIDQSEVEKQEATPSYVPREFPLIIEQLSTHLQAYPDAGRPKHARIINQMLELYPAPDTEWQTLVLEGRPRESALINEQDRAVVDGEALIELATILICEDLELRDVRQRRADWLGSMARLRNLDRPAQMYNVASERYAGPVYRQGNDVGPNATYTTRWSPW